MSEPLTAHPEGHGAPDPLPEPCAVGLREMAISQEAVDQLDRLMAAPSPLTDIVPRNMPDADPLPLDPPGLCQRCRKECRDFTEVAGHGYCDACAEEVIDLNRMHQALVGTGEP